MRKNIMKFITENRKVLIRTISLGIFIILSVVVTIKLYPVFAQFAKPDGQEHFKNYIDSLGVGGFFVMLGIQILQIIIAIIPGEPVEIVAGVIYGAWGGLFVCLLGTFIGSVMVFYAVKLVGYPLVTVFFDEDKINNLKFLKNTKKLEYLTFILFFIPGTPKDVLTYFAGLTTINPLRFFLIATFARIPSIITSTYAGLSIREGDWVKAIIVFIIAGILAVIGILIKEYIVKRHNKHKDTEEHLQ